MSDENQIILRGPGDLQKYLERSKGSIQMALPKHLNPERMMRLAMTCFSTSPKLRLCTPQSILSSVMVASQLGLEPGIAGQGYLIPYKDTCTFVPGWQGLVGLLNNSGRATAWTGAVFDGDEFSCSIGSNPHIDHIPGDNAGDPKKLIGAYACGKVNGSEMPVIEFWKAARIWKHRDRFNKVGSQHYSFTHPEMYARKVVLLQVLKYMPRSIELNNALTAANASDAGNFSQVDGGVVVEIVPEPEDIPRAQISDTKPAEKPVEAEVQPDKPKAEPKKEEKKAKVDKPVDPAPEPAKEPASDSPSTRQRIKIAIQEIGMDEPKLMVILRQLQFCTHASPTLAELSDEVAESVWTNREKVFVELLEKFKP